MERASAPGMRNRLLWLLLPTALACGEEAAVVAGHLADDAEATHVWVLGGSGRSVIEADSFLLEEVRGDPVDLRFASGDEEVGRMEIRGLGPGTSLRLRGVWFDGGTAHPTGVEVEAGPLLSVNGLRFGGAGAIPEQVDAVATVLSVAPEGDALIVRPVEDELPDLRVVVTPGTRVLTPDGDPAEAKELEFGDSLRVKGLSEAGYVVALELVLPRERAGGRDRE